jgi:hypothetical protein
MMAKAAEIRAGESITTVTTGTCRPSWSSRSPCGAWSPWKPQTPRWVVAPLIPAARSRRMIARCTGWPSCSAASDVYTISFCHSRSPVASVPAAAAGPMLAGTVSDCPSRLQIRTRSSVSSGWRSRAPSSGRTRPIRSPEPTAITIIGVAVLRLKKAARSRRPSAVPSTPSSAVAPATPRRCSRSQTATKAGTRNTRSWRPR